MLSQVRSYDENAILIATENIQGTARYTAMSGAFGALGGNLSATNANPASFAVFNQSEVSITLGNKSNNTDVQFGNTTTNNSNSNFGFPQGGAVLIFDNDNKAWSKFGVGINFTKTNQFDQKYLIKGNDNISNELYFLEPVTGIDLYDNVSSQKMLNHTIGDNTKTNFTFSGKYLNNTYFGISISNNTISYEQTVNINEQSADVNNNTFNANQVQKLLVNGEGLSMSFGVITKPYKNLRLGLSYQTPTFYTLEEEYTENTDIMLSNDNDVIETVESAFEYELKTPSKLTGSIAYVFGEKGLISMDYDYKDYSSIKISPTSEFTNENDFIDTQLSGISSLKIGAEYRLNKLSFRGGFNIEESIYKNILSRNTDATKGYSLGLGMKLFNNSKLDFSYTNTFSRDTYFYLNAADPAELVNDDHRINATITFSL